MVHSKRGIQLYLFLLALSPFNLAGQAASVSSVLATAQQDATVEYQEDHVDFMVKNQRSLPFPDQLYIWSYTG